MAGSIRALASITMLKWRPNPHCIDVAESFFLKRLSATNTRFSLCQRTVATKTFELNPKTGAQAPERRAVPLDNMDALRFEPSNRKLSLVRLEIPSELGENDVLIQVVYAGVCGTDLHIVEGNFPCNSKPFTMGHEFCGIVKKVGAKVTHITEGMKVAVDPNSGCGTCHDCHSANYHYCEKGGLRNLIGIHRNGGWAQYSIAPADQVYKIPENIPLSQAVLSEPISCLSHGLNRITPVPVGSTILIQGAGIIGNLSASMLHLQGHREVIVSEPMEGRRKLAAKLETGFEIVSPDELKARKASQPKWGVDLVIDCSGFGPAIQESLNYLNSGGQLCLFGVASPQTRISVSPYDMFDKELSMVAVNTNPFSFNKALGFISSMGERYLNYEKLGIKEYSLNEYEEALAALKKGKIAKAVFKILT